MSVMNWWNREESNYGVRFAWIGATWESNLRLDRLENSTCYHNSWNRDWSWGDSDTATNLLWNTKHSHIYYHKDDG